MKGRRFNMRKDFKKAGYFLTILIFLLGMGALVISTAATFFDYNKTVVMVGQGVSLLALIMLVFTGISAKRSYNYVCTKFADYIIGSRQKEAEQQQDAAQRVKEIQAMKAAAERERKNAVAAALEQGRTEGMQSALQNTAEYAPAASAAPAEYAAAPAAQASPSFAAPQPRMMPQPSYAAPQPANGYQVEAIMPNDEVLYNEYGEPVMIRRRVRRRREPYVPNAYYGGGAAAVPNIPVVPEAPAAQPDNTPQ